MPPTRPADSATHAYEPAGDGPPDAPAVPGFDVLGELGAGNMGVVYLARQRSLDRQVALKMLLAGRASAAETRRFLLEAEAVAAITHPNVVRIHECGEHAGRPYLALEYLPGGTLAERLASDEPMPVAEAALMVERVARGVAAAHLRGIVHRDIKPANVLLDADGAPKVSDFGLAKRLEGDETQLTQSGALLGTPAYMAPEQAARDGRAVGPATDVFALGVVLFECLTGRRPFGGDSVLRLLDAVVNAEPPDARSLRREVPRDLATVCAKCLAKDPSARYPDAGELAEDLRRWREVEPIRARPVGPLRRAGKWLYRNHVLAGMLGAVLAVSVVAVGFGLFAIRESGRANDRTAEAGRALALSDDLVTVGWLRRAQEYWSAGQGGPALEALGRVRAGHRDRPEYRLLDWQMRRQGQFTLEGVRGRPRGVALSADGRVALALSGSNHVQLWDARTGEAGRTLDAPQGEVWRAILSADGGAAVLAGPGATRVLDARSGAARAELAGPVAGRDLAVSADGTAVATLDAGGRARAWRIDARGPRLALDRADSPAGPTRALALAADGSRLALGGGNGAVQSLPVEGGGFEEIHFIDGKAKPVAGLALGAADRVWLIEREGQTEVWDRRDGSSLGLTPGKARFDGAALSGDGRRVVTGSESGSIDVQDARTGATVQSLLGHEGRVVALATDATGSTVVSTAEDQTVRVWDARPGQGALVGPGDGAGALAAVSADGSRLVALGAGGAAVWDADGGAGPVRLGAGRVAALSGDGARLASPDADGSIRVWDSVTARVLLRLPGRHDGATVLALDRDGGRVAAASDDGTARLWDGRTGAELLTLRGHHGHVTAVFLSADGGRVVTGSADGTAIVWDAATGRALRTLNGHEGGVGAVALSADGARVVTGSADRTARIWDIATGDALWTLRGHGAEVTSVSLTADGARVATASPDGTVRLWDAGSGLELISLPGVPGGRVALLTPDGTRLVTPAPGGVARVWRAPRPER